jgi:hypothetical protein
LRLDGWVRALRLKAHALAEAGNGRRRADVGTKPARREGRPEARAGEAGHDRRRA